MQGLAKQPTTTMNNETPRILKPDDDAILKLAEHLPPIKCNILCVHTYRNSVKYDLNLWLDSEFVTFTRIYNVDSKFVLHG